MGEVIYLEDVQKERWLIKKGYRAIDWFGVTHYIINLNDGGFEAQYSLSNLEFKYMSLQILKYHHERLVQKFKEELNSQEKHTLL